MFEVRGKSQTGLEKTVAFFELVYHCTVRDIRKSGGENAAWGLVQSMGQVLIMVFVFYLIFSFMGMRSSPIPGDFLLYILSGIFIFLTHNKTVGAISGCDGPVSAMVVHGPMNILVMVLSTAISTLYTQVLALFSILLVYHLAVTPIYIYQPAESFAMVLLGWSSGVGVGMVLLGLRPFAPGFVKALSMVYRRVNMIASGKMVVANALPGSMIAWFAWNPLFHVIDQARGHLFVSYDPHHSTWTYPALASVFGCMIGLILKHSGRNYVSPKQWEAASLTGAWIPLPWGIAKTTILRLRYPCSPDLPYLYASLRCGGQKVRRL